MGQSLTVTWLKVTAISLQLEIRCSAQGVIDFTALKQVGNQPTGLSGALHWHE